MANEIAQFKAALTDLNMKCQLARDNEVRFALQRGRLEAERTQLLVAMVEAMAPAADTLAVAPVGARADYNVVMSCPAGKGQPTGSYKPWYPPVVPDEPKAVSPPRRHAAQVHPIRKYKRSGKPTNLPTTEVMIFAVLQGTGWMRPNEITSAIRDRYWPGAPRTTAPSVVWRLAQKGRLEKGDDGYRLPVVAAGPPEPQRNTNGQFGA
jgi:hypothetical protein